MSADTFRAQQWIDDSAKATRVTVVASDGSSSSAPGVQRTKSLQRVTTATTTTVAAGQKSYTVIVNSASSASSPTLDGVALPAGASVTFSVISDRDTLPSASLVTTAGDDVLIVGVS